MTGLRHVTSADGARIGMEVVGDGPPLVVVHGSTADHTRWAPVRDRLAEHFTLFLVDRRGRGLSREEPEAYAVEREAEDLLAVAAEAGGAPGLLAHSYGATCALEALPAGAFPRALLYEPAFSRPGAVLLPPQAAARMRALLADGAAEEALVVFFTDVIAAPPDVLAAARAMPDWPGRVDALARTFERESRVATTWELRPERYAGLACAVRLVLGTATSPGLLAACRAAHAALPGSELVELEGEGHVAMQTAPQRFTELVRDWFAGA